jgi:N-methylhydantoinase A
VLAERMPGVSISLSSEVSPQMRERERFNTVIANAYIKPLMHSYLSRLKDRLGAEGAACPVFLMHSGGGIISLQSAAEFPVRLDESGPAGGAVFATHITASHGLDKVLSFDMGSTTAKICLIRGQTPKTARVFEVARSYRFKKGSGMPISIPVIDMVEIGAGGGALAHVDALRQICVGPDSAGSEPGPACYGRGGTRPAVTDADPVLGRLDPDNFAGGGIPLDCSAEEDTLAMSLGADLGMAVTEAAFGLSEVVDENMANAARVHAVENGEDLGSYTMIAFGGAAPLHAARLCEKLGIARLLVPPGARVGSAIGFLKAPFSFEATRSVYIRLSAFDAATVTRLLEELRVEATAFVASCTAKVFMRYRGQGWEIPVPLPDKDMLTPEPATFKRLFETEYAKLFSRAVTGTDIEITVWAVTATTPSPDVTRTEPAVDRGELTVKKHRKLFDPACADWKKAGMIERARFSPGMHFDGPGVITEEETTIILPSSRTARCHPDGCIDITPIEGDAS